MNAANPTRGEAALPLGGETLVLRPSFEALVAAEGALGSLFALVERAAEGRLTLAEVAALFWHCVKDRPEGLTQERVGQAVAELGLAGRAGAQSTASADFAGPCLATVRRAWRG